MWDASESVNQFYYRSYLNKKGLMFMGHCSNVSFFLACFVSDPMLGIGASCSFAHLFILAYLTVILNWTKFFCKSGEISRQIWHVENQSLSDFNLLLEPVLVCVTLNSSDFWRVFHGLIILNFEREPRYGTAHSKHVRITHIGSVETTKYTTLYPQEMIPS